MGPDFSALLAAVDFGDVGSGLLAIAALMAVPLVVTWGAEKVLAFIEARDDSEQDRDRE